MASRNSQKNRTAKRKARQDKAFLLFQQVRKQQDRRVNLDDLHFRDLREPVKQAVVELLKAVENPK